MTRTVLIVCAHGVAKSRQAAALFSRAAPDGRRAVAAGLQPQDEISVSTVVLGAGADRDAVLDRQPPRPVPDVSAATAVRIDCDLPGAARWDLAHQQVGAAMHDELRERVGDLARPVADAGL